MEGMSGNTIDLGRRYTLADLEAFPEDGRRFELACRCSRSRCAPPPPPAGTPC